MDNILKIVELFLAILGAYYLLLRIIAFFIYKKLMKSIDTSKKENAAKPDIKSPKYVITDSCPICGSNNIDIFEQYVFSSNEEKNFDGYVIGCLDCGLQSPVLNSMENCIDYWNTRDHKKTYNWVSADIDNIPTGVQNGQTE